MNCQTVAGAQAVHLPDEASRSSVGAAAAVWPTLIWRMAESVAAAFSASKSRQPPTVISMFDWPPQSHTSPTSTSLSVSVFSPAMVISRGDALAGIASRRTIHLPPSSAVADFSWPPKRTVTFSPAFAHPQTGTGMPRCRTIPSPKILASRTAAKVSPAHSSVPTASTRAQNVLQRAKRLIIVASV